MTLPSAIFGLTTYIGNPDWYASLSLTDTSPTQSFTEPLSLEEAKSFLKVPERSPADSGEDLDLQVMISGARSVAEYLQGRDLVQKQWDLMADYWPFGVLSLRAPLVSVDLVQYRDSTGAYHQLAEDTDYLVDTARQPGIVTPTYNKVWPSYTAWPTSSLLVRFTSGYASTSAFWADDGRRIKHGMKKLVLLWYTTRLAISAPVEEIPFGITNLLSFGSVKNVR